MTREQKRRAAELYRQRYEQLHPRTTEPALVYYARAIEWLGTPEGFAVFKQCAQEASQ